jgi:hypothetical protein
MAAGLPIFAAVIGPIAELCDDGVEARFWPLDNPAPGGVHPDETARRRADPARGCARSSAPIPA